MMTSLDRDEQNALACRILATLPSGMGHVRIILPDRDAFRQIRFEQKRTGGVLRHRADLFSRECSWGHDLSMKGRRLFVVRHEDTPWSRECILPVMFGVHVLGWIGAPLPRMEYWTQYLQGSWSQWIRSFSKRMGTRMVRAGKLPELESDGPILQRKSLNLLASKLSDSGEKFGMLYIRPDKLEMSDSLADLLRSTIREGDAVAAGDTGAAALCVGGSPDGIRERISGILSDATELDWRMSGEIRFGYCESGRFRNVTIDRIRPMGRIVRETSSRLSSTFRRLGLLRTS